MPPPKLSLKTRLSIAQPATQILVTYACMANSLSPTESIRKVKITSADEGNLAFPYAAQVTIECA